MAASRQQYWTHSLLFFAPLYAAGLWNVPLSGVLRGYGQEGILAYCFAGSALAAIASPLIAGGLADQRMSPERLLRWLGWVAAITLALAFLAIERGWGAAAVLALVTVHSLASTPILSIVSTIVLAQMADPTAGFARVRVWGTVGWVVSGWTVSWVLRADASPLCGYVAAGVLAAMAAGLAWMPESAPPDAKARRTWREIFGLDALELLTHRDHRVVFLTTILFSIPLAAFVPFTPLHLRELGVAQTTATMTLGQVTEVVCLIWLGHVIERFRLKWIFLAAIGFGVARYALYATDVRWLLLVGISLHGLCYTLFFVTAQIYMAERIDAAMRARAQSLFFLISSGLGNLLGFLLTGWWKTWTTTDGQTQWPLYWGGLALLTAAIGVYFHLSYHGLYHGLRRQPSPAEPAGR